MTKIEFSNGNRFEGSWNGDLDGDGTMYYGDVYKRQGEARGGKKILLVVSDGEDEQTTGITKEEVDVQIREGELSLIHI